jgi:hypothetical protein
MFVVAGPLDVSGRYGRGFDCRPVSREETYRIPPRQGAALVKRLERNRRAARTSLI